MKYFIDTEFIEGFYKPLFGKRRHFIELISIGIIDELGREYYAISNEFNPKLANQWVKENVIDKLEPKEVSYSTVAGIFHKINPIYKSNKQIANEIKEFIYETSNIHNPETISNLEQVKSLFPIEFYGYYADYDWVLFCSLFGKMIDLPKGFPMYCKDLKQIFDEKQALYFKEKKFVPTENIKGKIRGTWFHDLKNHIIYPYQHKEHNALEDAKWNYELYKFLNKIKI